MPLQELRDDHRQGAKLSAGRIIYLACPYTDADSKVRDQRFRAATAAAALLIKEGNIVYSPITMTHPIDVLLSGDVGTLGSEYWVAFDEAFMNFCAEIVVLKIPGWDKSSGVQREIAYFEKQGKPVRFMLPNHSVFESS
jgi:hypothetical protein